jgi:hypothetical protein
MIPAPRVTADPTPGAAAAGAAWARGWGILACVSRRRRIGWLRQGSSVHERPVLLRSEGSAPEPRSSGTISACFQ